MGRKSGDDLMMEEMCLKRLPESEEVPRKRGTREGSNPK